MNLPTFEYESSTYIKRITLITIDGVIKKTFYPVFPPDKNVMDVIQWVEHNQKLNFDAAKKLHRKRGRRD